MKYVKRKVFAFLILAMVLVGLVIKTFYSPRLRCLTAIRELAARGRLIIIGRALKVKVKRRQ